MFNDEKYYDKTCEMNSTLTVTTLQEALKTEQLSYLMKVSLLIGVFAFTCFIIVFIVKLRWSEIMVVCKRFRETQ